MRKSRVLALVVVLVAVFGVTGRMGQAQAATSGVKGLVVSPALKEVTLGKDEPEATFTFSVTNTSDAIMNLKLSTLDFGALNESGGLAFLGQSGQESQTYGLKQWLGLEKEALTLKPGESQKVQATVANKLSLAPGGHYGAITVTAGEDNSTSGKSVSVLPSASVLILLKKTGGDVYKLNLVSAAPARSIISLPKEVDLRFRNEGNTHVVPRGTVTLKDPLGHVISRGIINEDSAFVLPEAHRVLKVRFTSAPHGWLPGRYTVTATWRHDGTTKTSTSVMHVWYIGLIPLILVSVLVFIICTIFVQKRLSRKRTPRI
jgi:hypothetical protein